MTPQRAPWAHATYRANQSAADADAQALGEAIQIAIRLENQARARYERASRAEHDSALWAWRSAQEYRDRLLRQARELGLEASADTVPTFTDPAATLGWPWAAMAAVAAIIGAIYGGPGLRGLLALSAIVAGAWGLLALGKGGRRR